MKNRHLVFIVAVILILTSCRAHQEFEFASRNIVPDSLKTAEREMLQTLVRTAHPADLTGKSRNFGDIVYASETVSRRSYEITIHGLEVEWWDNGQVLINRIFIPENELTPEQQKIYAAVCLRGEIKTRHLEKLGLKYE